jgi:membrane protease YdiL (CAAX protease family)
MTATGNRLERSGAVLALALIVPAPTLGLVAALYLWPEQPLGQLLYAVPKVWLLALPLAWVVLVDRRRPRLPRLTSRGIGEGLATGALMFVVIVAAYRLFGHWIDTEAMAAQIAAIGLGTPTVYLAAALYWCTVNSILEEYVWRWFVFTRCEVLMSRGVAATVGGVLFTMHHVIALAYYFDWRVTLIGSAGVFIGGTTWTWLYLRWRNIYAAYVSHVCADLAVFGVGWHIVFGNGAG